jgi:hypothetical protein
MKRVIIIGFLFINACVGVDKAMNKQEQAEFLVKNYLYDSLKNTNDYGAIKFDKLDTEKSYKVEHSGMAIVVQDYLQNLVGKYWLSCTYSVKNVRYQALFGIDTTLKKIDTAIIRRKQSK